MYHRLRYGLVLLLVGCGLLIARSVALAGADAVKVVVQDPQSGAEIEVTEPEMLGFFAFANLSQPLPTAPTVGEGYVVTRYWSNGPFDRFHYYAGTADTAGYVFYDGFLQGWSDSDGRWYQALPEADQAMRRLLAANGLGFQAERANDWLVGLAVVIGMGAVALAATRRVRRWSRVARMA